LSRIKKKVITSHNQKLTQEEKTYVDEEGKEYTYKVSKEAEPTINKLTITITSL